ncbi:MAG: hypothetical protein QXE51_04060 [Nitrososphaeria archaeon]
MSLRIRFQRYVPAKKDYRDILSFSFKDAKEMIKSLSQRISVYCEGGKHEDCPGEIALVFKYGQAILEANIPCRCSCHEKK